MLQVEEVGYDYSAETHYVDHPRGAVELSSLVDPSQEG